MKRNQGDRKLLVLSVCSFFLMSISFMLMPIDAIGILPGLFFWVGLIAGIVLQIVLERHRKAQFAAFRVRREKIQKARNGLLSFGTNQAAKIADIVLLCSVIATVLAFVFTRGSGYWCYVFIATTSFSFCLHCILNGRIYFHVMNPAKIRQMVEQEKENMREKGVGMK